MNHGFGLEKPGLLAVRHPVAAFLLLAVLLLGAASTIPNLNFDEDINRVFLSDNESSENYRTFIKDIGGKFTDFAVFVEADQPLNAEDYTRLRDLALELELLDNVDAVLSPFAARFPKTDTDHPGEAVIPADINVDVIETRLKKLRSTATFMRPLISDNRRSALLIVSAETGLPSTTAREIYNQIQETSAPILGSRLRFTVSGEDAITIAIVEGLKSDLLRLNILGSLMVFLLALVIFRDLITALVAVVPAVLGVLASLSVFTALGYPITVVSNVLPVLVLVLGIADSLHLVQHLRHQSGHEPIQESLERTLRDIGPACALTALTTSIAFLAIAISDNDQLFEFAVIGAISVILSFFVVTTSFALLGKFVKRSGPRQDNGVTRWNVLIPVSTTVSTQAGRIIALSVVLFFAGAFGYSQTQTWFSYESNIPRDSGLNSANERLFSEFGGTYRLWSELETNGENSLGTEAGWNRLVRVTEAIEKAAPDYPTVSMVSMARWLGIPNRLPTSKELTELPDNLKEQLVSDSAGMARIVTLVPEPMRNQASREVHDRIEQAALEAGADHMVGLPSIMRHESISIIEQLGLGLLIACLSSTFLIAVAFRWPGLIIVLLGPNILPLILTASSLHFLSQGQLTPTAVMAMTIAFGIAVDDSIHFVNRFRLERNRGNSVDEALDVTIQETGRVMALTTLLLSLGLLITLTSVFGPIQVFGQLLILTFVIALLADLLLLPALLKQKWVAS